MVLRFFGFLFAAATLVFVLTAGAIAFGIWYFGRDLPDYTALQNYEPAVMSRVHAGDGALLGEFARERRLFLPIQAVPRMVINAFVSAEDKNFWTHRGVDPEGLARAVVNNIRYYGQRRPEGASTITQQVAKNFLLTNEASLTRKIREALVALRMEQTFSKERILELYLNDIFLGSINGIQAYGLAAAALLYFDKSVHELTLAEAAYLAALPKGPNNYHPFRAREAAIVRRNYVLDRMLEDGHITRDQHREARAQPLEVAERHSRTASFSAEYFTEEVRRRLIDMYGEQRLYEGGLSVRTTIDPRMQVMLRRALVDGLVRFDQQYGRGWRGPVGRIPLAPGQDWGEPLGRHAALADIGPWRLAIVLQATTAQATIGLQPPRTRAGEVGPDRETGTIVMNGLAWARPAEGPRRGATPRGVSDVLNVGDVVYVEASPNQQGVYLLRQIPEVSGGAVAMDPHTGRVLAMVGGFSFSESSFNRATQAYRQPGSSFKPFVYAAALDNGYTPASVVLDAPFELDLGPGQGVWRPQNYDGRSAGPSTLRLGIERSRNLMTIRLAADMGMPMVAEYSRRFGIYDDMPLVLSTALGAGETTVLRMVAGYSMFANGGRRIRPTLIDRIQDRYGRTIFRHDERECRACNADRYNRQAPPQLVDRREQVIDPGVAYQMTSMMEGVVQRGTGAVIGSALRGWPLAGKTGTTNDERDAWFVGYAPNLAMGVYLGYDRPRPMGRGGTGGGVAAPIFRDFMRLALADRPRSPFPVPDGVHFVRIDARTGLRTSGAGANVILEAFRQGQEPPDSFSIIGYTDQAGRPLTVSPEADRAVGSGTGGLY
jgi:penicillin-binding protein 1A